MMEKSQSFEDFQSPRALSLFFVSKNLISPLNVRTNLWNYTGNKIRLYSVFNPAFSLFTGKE